MSRFDDHREALLAEVLGEVTALLDRVDVIIERLDASAGSTARAAADMDARAVMVERTVTTFMEASKVALTKHVAGRSEELARQAAAAQVKAMQAAAQKIFANEFAPAFQRLERILASEAVAQAATRRWLYLGAPAVAFAFTLGIALMHLMSP